MRSDRLADISNRLDAIAEELADLAHGALLEAVDQASPQALADERLLARARRSVMKAAALVGGRTGAA